MAQQLADLRLAVVGRDPTGQEMAELSHEALIWDWARLQAWLDQDRTFRAWQERLRVGVGQWEAGSRDEGPLLCSVLLVEAEEWLKSRGSDLGAAEREFIEAGIRLREQQLRQAESRRQREMAQLQALAGAEHRRAEEQARAGRRLRWLALGLAVVLLMAVGAAIWARREQQQAQKEPLMKWDFTRAG